MGRWNIKKKAEAKPMVLYQKLRAVGVGFLALGLVIILPAIRASSQGDQAMLQVAQSSAFFAVIASRGISVYAKIAGLFLLAGIVFVLASYVSNLIARRKVD
jgi:hypothetical protein